MKKLTIIIFVLLMLFGCGKSLEINNVSLEKDPKFGGVFIHKTIEEFCALGFEYGDSVNVEFSNGVKLDDIPFYDGYYCKVGEPLLVGYPGYPYICMNYNYLNTLYDDIGLDDSMSVNIKLNQKGKYLSTQNNLKLSYSNNREDYDSDVIFSNFRVIDSGNIKSNTFYRSASPCDDIYNRATYVDKLIKQYEIKTIIDIADDEEEIEEYYNDSLLNCSYWKGLYENNRVFPLDMSINYRSELYKEKVNKIFKIILENDGPYLIHCTEGKDRTGFVCALIESLMGYTYEEVLDDYMETYNNYYGVNLQTDKDRYDDIVEIYFRDGINTILNGKDLYNGAKDYLVSCGLTDKEIELFINKIKK